MLWFFLGAIAGAVFCYAATGARAGKYTIKWYQWALGLVATLLYALTIQNYLGFQAEHEPAMANLMLLVIGAPAVIATVLIWAIPRGLAAIRKQPGRQLSGARS